MAGDVLVAATCIPDPGQARRKINALKHSYDSHAKIKAVRSPSPTEDSALQVGVR